MIPIYIGKGKGNRLNHHLSKKCHNRILKRKIQEIKNSGFEVIIQKFQENLTHEDALLIEIELIAKFGKIYNNTGTLCNFTDGGDGSAGFIKGPMPEYVKLKLSKSLTGRKLTEEHKEKLRLKNLGKKMSPEAIAKTRLAHIGSKRSQETCEKIRKSKIGFVFSEESKKKISDHSKMKKEIIQLTLNGDFIRFWDSISDAAKSLGIKPSNISRSLSHESYSSGGFRWKLKNNVS